MGLSMSGKELPGGFDAPDEVRHLNQFRKGHVIDLVYDFSSEHFAGFINHWYTSLYWWSFFLLVLNPLRNRLDIGSPPFRSDFLLSGTTRDSQALRPSSGWLLFLFSASCLQALRLPPVWSLCSSSITMYAARNGPSGSSRSIWFMWWIAGSVSMFISPPLVSLLPKSYRGFLRKYSQK